jgi:hypothetical protein
MSSATEQLPVAMLNGVEGGGAVAVLRCCCGKKLECSDLNRQKLAISISGDVFWVIFWGLNRRGGLKSLKEDILSATASHRISLSTDPAYRLYGWGHKALRRIWRPLESHKARLFCQYYISSITHTSWRLLLIGTYKRGLIGLTRLTEARGHISNEAQLAPFPWHTKLDTMSN